jgi:hypothetical protein
VITTTAIVHICGLRDAKTCTKCKVTQHRMNFGKNSAMRDGLNYQCRDCVKKVRDARKAFVQGIRKR